MNFGLIGIKIGKQLLLTHITFKVIPRLSMRQDKTDVC